MFETGVFSVLLLRNTNDQYSSLLKHQILWVKKLFEYPSSFSERSEMSKSSMIQKDVWHCTKIRKEHVF